MSDYETGEENKTGTTPNAYEPVQTGVISLDMYNLFLPRKEFQQYKDATDRPSGNTKWFVGGLITFITVIGILFTIAIFLIPRVLNENDRDAIKSFDERLQTIEKRIEAINSEIGDLKNRLPQR